MHSRCGKSLYSSPYMGVFDPGWVTFLLSFRGCLGQISEHQELDIGLEFECNGFNERNNFSKAFSKPKRGAQVIGVWGAPHYSL